MAGHVDARANWMRSLLQGNGAARGDIAGVLTAARVFDINVWG